MKIRKIAKDILELFLLLMGFWFGLLHFGKDVASHDGIVIVILFVAYVPVFILNAVFQITVSIKSASKGKTLLLKRAGIFVLLLLFPTLIFFLFFIGDGSFALMLALSVSGMVLLLYIAINALLLLINYVWEEKYPKGK